MKFNMVEMACKFWITSSLEIAGPPTDFTSFFYYIFRIENAKLWLNKINYGDLKQLAKMGTYQIIKITSYDVSDSNEKVPIEKVFELFPNAKCIHL